ncbi:hypothetical protein [Jeotgalibaca caeni]|uniref:hypothetical protein n=1 Tax=Jeotgalibaca caeni TaxID=3028623 RepID=UPI00237EDBA2|nr:hypothetical protein [Jeotgalibaca caeni]MDE1549548.1 hypothetical protein [Jeotgalibaca caeni]
MSVIETIELKTIHDLHDFLSPAGVKKEFFAKEEQYLFRGEESNQYRLNPCTAPCVCPLWIPTTINWKKPINGLS